ncbi:MAG: PAS domain-containing protein [Oscillochloris sp.]|nr:PAS domain-containing protein [Oscillochloris sp.]
MPYSLTTDHTHLEESPEALRARITALEARVADLEGLLGYFPGFLARYDRAHRHRFVSTSIGRIVGLPIPEVLDKTTQELGLPAHIVTLWERVLSDVFATGQPARFQIALPSTTGFQHYDAEIVPEFDPDGHVATVLAVTREAIDPVRAEQELRQHQALLQSLFDHTPALILIKDRAGRIMMVNHHLATIIARPPDQILGKTMGDIFSAQTAAIMAAYDQQVFTSGQALELELPNLSDDRGHTQLGVLFPIQDAQGVTGALGLIAIDITARKEIERALATQLRYAQALALCSRILLTPAQTAEAFHLALDQTLEVVRKAVGADRMHITHYTQHTIPSLKLAPHVLAAAVRPNLLPLSPFSSEEAADLPHTLRMWQQSGGSYNGPIAAKFSDYPYYQHYSEVNNIQSIYIQALNVGEHWWGHVSAIDHQQARSWGAGAVQLIRTAAEMIVTFAESWETTQALAAQLRYAEALTRCSQALLVAGPDANDWTITIRRALAALRDALGCRRLALSLYQAPAELLTLPSMTIADEVSESISRQDMLVDSARLAPAVLEIVSAGGWVAGTPEELYPGDTAVRKACLAGGIQSLFIAGLQAAGLWRGNMVASEAALPLSWSESRVGLLRTGLDMIGAFLHQHETTATLRTREAMLQTTQMRQAALLRAIPDLLLGVNGAGMVHFAHVPSPLPLEIPESVIGRPLGEVLPLGLVAGLAPGIAQRAADSPPFTFSLIALGAPQERTVESRIVRMDDREVLLIVRDVTAQRQAQADLERARDAAEAATRAKSAFLASMSHEIRTPLNAVIGMTSLLQDTILTSEQQVCVETIRTGGQALLAVISDILDFSRIESGHVDLQSAPFDLPACLAATVALVNYGARQKGLSVNSTCDPSLPQAVVGDEARLRQVLLNLLGNAVKFTSQGEVSLHAIATAHDPQTAWVTITVCDTGIGMTPDQLTQIFEPFVQADRATAQRYGGTGLGLTISRQLVEMMGGQIEVVSALGIGSTFSIGIPFTIASEAPPARPALPEVTTTRSLHVLMAEDNPLNQKVVQRMLIHLGHTVTVVDNGQAAVAAVIQRAYDVVLMDAQMPILDGEGATRRIRELGPYIPQPYIIALTANALAGDRERFLRAGMDDYLSKPVQPIDLQLALARAGPPNEHPNGADKLESAQFVGECLVNWDVIDQMVEPDAQSRTEMGVTILQLFGDAMPAQLEAVDLAFRAGDVAALRRAAHRLRGACLQLGAQSMTALCMQLEQVAGIAEAEVLANKLHVCYDETLAQLQRRFA